MNHSESAPSGIETAVRAKPAGVTYLKLIAAGEPYRLLFPVGMLFGIIGVLLWPLFAVQCYGYPGIVHPRIMIEGFMTAFVFGFLGTALPRLMELRTVIIYETVAYAFLLGTCTILLLMQKTLIADCVYLFTLAVFILALLWRAPERKDVPPPGFVLVAMGLLCALCGAMLFVWSGIAPGALSPNTYNLSKLLAYQGYLLLPIMGIGAFLLPRFFGLKSRHDLPEMLHFNRAWLQRASFSAICGVAVIGSFFIEAFHSPQIGYAIRAIAVVVYFLREIPFNTSEFSKGSLVWAIRIALFSIPAGYLCMALIPERQAAFIHIVFISGFSLITLTVASRVILGHSGQSALFKLSLKSIIALIILFILAMVTRVTADWFPDIRWSHLAYASILWIAGALIWAVSILPGVQKPDSA